MTNKLYVAAVLMLWVSTMSWLVATRIVPPFFKGDPPLAIFVSAAAPTVWRISLNNRVCGVAATQVLPAGAGASEHNSRLKLNGLPVAQIAPPWMRGMFEKLGSVSADVQSAMVVDALGNLTSFSTRIRIDEAPSLVAINGSVRGESLRVRVRAGEWEKSLTYPWHRDGSLSGDLMPPDRLTGLHVGRRWRSTVYNPLGSYNALVGVIEAEVVAQEQLAFQGKLTPMFRIEYRDTVAAGVSESDRLRSEVWVSEQGVVLRQEIVFLNTRLGFERMPAEEAEKLPGEWLPLGMKQPKPNGRLASASLALAP